MVRKMIFTFRLIFRIWRAASMPLSKGIEISMTMMSGRSNPAAVTRARPSANQYREPDRGRFGDIGGRLSWTLGTSDGLLARAVRFLHGHGTLFRPTDAMAD